MAGKVINTEDWIIPDQLGWVVARNWMTWDLGRAVKKQQWEEVRKYVYATDTTQTTNSKLPWKNKTTLPKLCQIRDNLHANYMAALFPRRKWLTWEPGDIDSNDKRKADAVKNYCYHMIKEAEFKKEISKLVYDYIDYGNVFATRDWVDQRQQLDDHTKVGYVGPMVRRISPLDIVFNPVAASFTESPKIVRSIISIGEVKEILERETTDENKDAYEELWSYLKRIRDGLYAGNGPSDLSSKDALYNVDGFTSYRHYLDSGYCELLTFYGDIYDRDNDKFLKNYFIQVVDRHKVIVKKPYPGFFGTAPIRHVGWRPRQDNLWAMGPLDNLVGLQYRLDHVENLKADVFDLITFPPLKIKGYVDEFEWGPFSKIHLGDQGDVEMVAPPFQVLQANIEIQAIEQRMEEMAGAPKEAMGIRTPGEKTAFEVQRLENASGRIFSMKTAQFEELIEASLNDCLELGRRMMDTTQVSVFDDELKFTAFQEVSPDDLKVNGRIVPIAARNFAEKARLVQNLQSVLQLIAADQGLQVHFSGIKTAQLLEEAVDIEDYHIVMPFVRLAEQKQAEQIASSNRQSLMNEMGTPTGMGTDSDEDMGMNGLQGLPNG